MPIYTTEDLGRLIARAHYQAWRLDAPPFDLTPEELAAILPNLIKSGSAGIVWHRVKPVRERYGAMAYALEAATETQIAHNQRVEEAVVECVTRLRAFGIEPVLVKGLALAKLYPEGIVRPAGDIDLVVRKEEFAAAQALLHDSKRDPIPVPIDLKHPDTWEEIPNRTYWSRIRDSPVRDFPIWTLGHSDNQAMICLHFLKHGGMRPLWLCDYSLTLDHELPADTDDAGVRGGWQNILASLCFALIGANPGSSASVPTWVPDTVFDQWIHPREVIRAGALTQFLSNPLRLPAIVGEAFPTPIAATFWEDAKIGDAPPRRAQVRRVARLFSTHIRHNSSIQLSQSLQSLRSQRKPPKRST